MRKTLWLSGGALALALAMTVASGAAFAATTGPAAPPSGQPGQNGLQTELVQALATASGLTTTEIKDDIAGGETLPQLAQKLAGAGTITQSTLAAAIEQELAANDETMASNIAQGLISGQMPASPGNNSSGSGPSTNSAPPGQTGGSLPTGGSGTSTSTAPPGGAGGNPPAGGGTQGPGGGMQNSLIEALATASGLTTTEIKDDIAGGETLTQLAQKLAGAGTITQSTLAAAIQKELIAADEQRAAAMAQSLVNGKMPGPGGGIGGANAATIVLTIGSSKMTVDGVEQDIDPGYQTSPQIVDGSTFVPIRAIVEKLGGSISWDAADQKVTITLNNTTIELYIGSKTATVNGVSKTLDSAPFISASGRTMLPLRFISENLGLSIHWDGTNRTITIQ